MTKNIYKTIGKVFKNKRIDLRLRQQDIANKIGKDRSTYTYYESGKARMDIDTYLELCKILEIDANELMNQIIKEMKSL